MATARVVTTILRLLPVFVYNSGDPRGRHARLLLTVRVWYNSTYRRYKKASEDFMDMHRSGRAGEHDTPYIWLRYSMQFTTGGRAHTIEMEIPVPVGASAEQREQLIREAEAGIEQMYRQIEKRGAGRGQQPPEASRPQAPAQTAPSAAPNRQPAQSAPPQQVAVQAN